MSYLALYRKYRSTNFDEVYGQDAIVKTLKNALANNKIAHAYLFSGPRGTGKTSVARLFAKALNCEEGLGHECNKCDNCHDIAKGNHPDVIEIDAASNSGVDEVRNLIDKIKYAPIKGRYKVYIIDEVHMMSNSAFNALLKTLEEPPSYVVFILCTTELYKVLPTIVSRCQRYEFKKLSDDALRNLLTNVLDKENVSYSSGVIDLLIELANGGARDALSILDQVISYSGNSIVVEDIENLFGLASKKDKISMLETIKNKDSLGLIKKFDELTYRNIDLVRFVSEIISLLKDALIFKSTGESENMYVKIAASYFPEEKLLSLIQTLIELQKEYKFTSNPSLITELYFLKMIQEETSTSSKVIVKEVVKEVIKEVPVKEEKKEEIKKEEKKVEEDKKTENIFTPNGDLLSALNKKEKEEKKEVKKEDPKNLKPLFDNSFKKAPLSSGLVSSDNSYHLDMDDLIKLTVLNNGPAKRELTKRWNLLTTEIQNEKDSQFIPILLDGTPFLITDNILVIRFEHAQNAKIVNTKAYQQDFSKLISRIIGTEIEIYGIDRSTSTDLVTRYRNLTEIGKLPPIQSIGKVTIKKED